MAVEEGSFELAAAEEGKSAAEEGGRAQADESSFQVVAENSLKAAVEEEEGSFLAAAEGYTLAAAAEAKGSTAAAAEQGSQFAAKNYMIHTKWDILKSSLCDQYLAWKPCVYLRRRGSCLICPLVASHYNLEF